MLRVDVEEEDEEGSVLLVPDTTCLLGLCKNILKIPEYPEMTCVAGATHTVLLRTAAHHDSKCMSHILNVQ